MCEKLSVIKMEEKSMKKLKKKGFTLIELIVVIAILGILAAIAIPRLSAFQNNAKISADIASYTLVDKTVATAVSSGSLGDGTVVMTVTSGVSVFTGTAGTAATAKSDASTSAAMLALMQSPVFKLPANVSTTAKVVTWTIGTDGIITVDKVISKTAGTL